MKIRYFKIAVLLFITSIFMVQSCTKDSLDEQYALTEVQQETKESIVGEGTTANMLETVFLSPITGPSSICPFSRPTIYSWTGTSVVDSWGVTGAINLVSSTGQTAEVTGRVVGTGILTAYDANLIPLGSRSIQVRSRPTSSGPPYPFVDGPTTITRGVFSTAPYNLMNSSSVTGHTSIEWTVFSYLFPNADQHFDIQNRGSRPTYANITALASAPTGDYTVQCRLINSCGLLAYEKVITVSDGPAIIFSF